MMGVTTQPLAATLRQRGLRLTVARAAILDAVEAMEHCTPEQIHERVQVDDPSTHVTTIYRNLDVLEQIGLIGHTHLGHGAPVYHLTEDQHVHVVCHHCESVISADAGVLTDVVATMQREHGFRVDVGHVTLSGECANCQGRSQ